MLTTYPRLLDNSVYQDLKQYHDILGTVCIQENEYGITASLGCLLEFRGDGLRTGCLGRGDSRDAALDDLWEQLTRPGRFFSIPGTDEQGTYRDFNYAWDGHTFITLPTVTTVAQVHQMLKHLSQVRERNHV